MVNINITFDRPDRRYNPGDVVNLDIRVQLSSEQKLRSIYVRFYGFSYVQWTESRQVRRNGKSHTETTTYHASETYMKHYKTLFGSEGGSEIRLPAGTHVYHAQFILPQRLPQSHEGTYGHIRYEVKAHMDIPWGFDEKEKVPIFIIPRFDLNEFPHLREPVRAEANKTFGCCCWESDPLRIYNLLPYSGFVPGQEQIQYTLELKNDSDVSISDASVELVEKITYHTHTPRSKTRSECRTLWEHEFTSDRQLVAAMQNKIYSTPLYFNPEWNFCFFDGCGIITVEYYIQSTACTSGCHMNLSNYTGITIGTIPLGNIGVPSAPLAPMPFPSAPNDYDTKPISEQPLPSYNDAMLKPGMAPPPATGIGWAGMGTEDTPPPAFTEVEQLNKKEKQ